MEKGLSECLKSWIEIEKKYESLCHQLQNPKITGDQNKFRQLMKEQSELEKSCKKISSI